MFGATDWHLGCRWKCQSRCLGMHSCKGKASDKTCVGLCQSLASLACTQSTQAAVRHRSSCFHSLHIAFRAVLACNHHFLPFGNKSVWLLDPVAWSQRIAWTWRLLHLEATDSAAQAQGSATCIAAPLCRRPWARCLRTLFCWIQCRRRWPREDL